MQKLQEPVSTPSTLVNDTRVISFKSTLAYPSILYNVALYRIIARHCNFQMRERGGGGGRDVDKYIAKEIDRYVDRER